MSVTEKVLKQTVDYFSDIARNGQMINEVKKYYQSEKQYSPKPNITTESNTTR